MGLTRRQTLLVKGETTYGADPTHAATDAQLLHDVDLQLNFGRYSRRVQTDLVKKRRVDVLGVRHYALSCWQEMRGNAADLSAVVKPMFHDLLVACGFNAAWAGGASTWTYTPSTGDSTGDGVTCGSVAVKVNYDGMQFLMLGGRGNCRFVFRPGMRAEIRYNLLFRYAAPTAVAIAAPDYADDVAPLIVQTLGFTPNIGGAGAYNPTAAQYGHIRSLEIDMRNNVVFRDSITLGSEGLAVVSTLARGTEDDPGPSIRMEVEQPSGVANPHVWWDWFLTQATAASGVTVTMGNGVAGNQQVFTLGGFHLVSVAQQDMGGRWGHVVEGRLLGTAAATEDDLLLVCS